ncbi:MAG: tetratricopeptide repeat protein [Myxococcota bacterium]
MTAGPPGVDAWITRLTQPDPADRYPRAAHALAALRALGDDEPTAPSRSSADPRGSEAEDSTRAVLSTIRSAAPASREVPRLARRPVPPDWRRPRHPWPAIAMVDAGLGLLRFRTLPLVGRHEARDALWSALRDVEARGRARAVQLMGPTGVGRSRLARWLVWRVHELGAAEVRDRRPDPDDDGLQVVVVHRPDVADAVHVARHLGRQAIEPTAVLWVIVGGVTVGEVEGATPLVLDPLPEADQDELVRAALPLEPGLSLEVAAHTRGLPGAVVDLVGILVAEEALVPSPEGFVLREDAVLPGRSMPGDADPLGHVDDLLDEVVERRRLGDRRGASRAGREAWASVEALDLDPSDPRYVRALAARVAGGLGSSTPEAYLARVRSLVEVATTGGFVAEEVEGRFQLAMFLNESVATRADAVHELQIAGSRAEAHGQWDVAVKAWYQLGYTRMFQGDLDEAEAMFRRCLTRGETGHDAGIHFGGMGLCDVFLRRGDPERGLTFAHRAVDVGLAGREHEAAGTLGCALLDLDRPAEAEPWMRRAVERSRELGSLAYESQMKLNLGCIANVLGREVEAEQHFLGALALAQLTGRSDLLVRLNLAHLGVRRGRFAEVVQILAPVTGERAGRFPVDLYHALLRTVGEVGAGVCADPEAAIEACEAELSEAHASAECIAVAEVLVRLVAGTPLEARTFALLEHQRQRLPDDDADPG